MLRPWREVVVTFVGSQVRPLPLAIWIVRAKRLILGESQSFLAFVIIPTKEEEEKNLQDIPMVRDFLDFFSTKNVGLLPQREVEFMTECIIGNDPVPKAAWRWWHWRSWRSSCKNCWIRSPSALVCHNGEHQCSLLRRMMYQWVYRLLGVEQGCDQEIISFAKDWWLVGPFARSARVLKVWLTVWLPTSQS